VTQDAGTPHRAPQPTRARAGLGPRTRRSRSDTASRASTVARTSSRISSEHDAIEPDQLRERPRLKRTTARAVRRIAIADLREVADARELEAREQRRDESPPRLGAIAVDAQPRLDERAGEPRPHRSVVIVAIAIGRPAAVAAAIPRVARRQRARPRRGPQ